MTLRSWCDIKIRELTNLAAVLHLIIIIKHIY